MADGFIVSGIGIVSAFGVLTILMMFTGLITKILPRGQFRKDSGDIAGGAVEAGEEVSGGERLPVSALDVLPQSPESTDEVAAIALAVAAHLRKQGKDLTGRLLVIEDLQYEVTVGDHVHSPVDVTVNGETFATSLDGKGLPVARGEHPARTQRFGVEQHGRAWRSACPVPQGGHWDRRGWSRSR